MNKKNYQRFRYSKKLNNAITDIKSGNISLNKGSDQSGLSKSTLHHELTNQVLKIRKILIILFSRRTKSKMVDPATSGLSYFSKDILKLQEKY